ncbi:MAG: hypothetical protein MZU97_08155 [Bacillus subtilis]|nr:hypothetical protein [Bacillus subtilis]
MRPWTWPPATGACFGSCRGRRRREPRKPLGDGLRRVCEDRHLFRTGIRGEHPRNLGVLDHRVHRIQHAPASVSATRQGREALAYGNGQVTTYAYDTWLGLSGMDQPGTPTTKPTPGLHREDQAGRKGTANALAFAYDGLGRLTSGEGA